jgi:2-isopropylmalate synthase
LKSSKKLFPGSPGTGALVRVLIFSHDQRDRWGTVGVSHDILEASCMALVDSLTYKLFKDRHKSAEED